MTRKLVYCQDLRNGVILECHGSKVEWLLPTKPCGIEDDVYVELAIKEGECIDKRKGEIVRSPSARNVSKSQLHWLDGTFFFKSGDVEEHGLHPMHVLLLITDPRAVEHTYLNALTRLHRRQFRDSLQALRDNGVYLVDVKSNEHTVDLVFNSIVFTVSKGE